MDQKSRELDQLVRDFWTEGETLALAEPVIESALGSHPRSLFAGARASAVLERVSSSFPESLRGRLGEFTSALGTMASRRRQVDGLGDLANPPQILFEVLGAAVDHLGLESFDEAALRSARVGQPNRAEAARALLDAFGTDRLPDDLADELTAALAELTDRAGEFQANALFEHQGQGQVLGLKVAINDSGAVSSFAEASTPMKKQAELALDMLGVGGASWQIEWPVDYAGESIGLGIYAAGLVAQGQLPSDPLLAVTGQIDVNGRVIGVAGVPAKLQAALDAGIQRALLPAENQVEAEATGVGEGVDLIFVDRVSEVRNRLMNAVPKTTLSNDGLIRGVRNLVPVEHLAVDDEKRFPLFYRFTVGDASGTANMDVYPNGTIVVGGHGQAHDAAARVRDLVLPSKPQPRAQRTVVIPSEDRRVRLHELISDLGAEEKATNNQYELWRFKLTRGQSAASITLYTTHKCVLSAGQAPAWDELWECLGKVTEGLGGMGEPSSPARPDRGKQVQVDESEAHIGTDEAGKGDFFGPLVSAAVYVDARLAATLREIGVKDSKLLSDKTVGTMAARIRTAAGRHWTVTSIPPKRFNDLYRDMKSEGKNLNTLLAWGHTRSIEDLMGRGIKPRFALVDQFADARYIEQKLLPETRERGLPIIQYPKAESDVAVAAASVLARDSFLKWLDTESKRLGMKLPKGASQQVIDAARELVARLGADALKDYAKVNFRTTEKVLAP